MDCKLSILIPTLESRGLKLKELLESLNHKPYKNELEILLEYDDGENTIGHKRNILLDRAIGEYTVFIDDDDLVTPDYLTHIFKGIKKGVDCISLRGVISWDGINHELFEHSLRYNEWRTTETGPIKYERTINHLNPIKSKISKQFSFLPISYGEDEMWSKAIHESGLLKTEHFVDAVTYHYQFITSK